MYSFRNLLRKEPVQLAQAVAVALTLASFALPISAQLQAAIVATVIALAGLFARARVIPSSKIAPAVVVPVEVEPPAELIPIIRQAVAGAIANYGIGVSGAVVVAERESRAASSEPQALADHDAPPTDSVGGDEDHVSAGDETLDPAP